MNIEIKNLNVSINKIEILKNINMNLSKGHLYGIVGRNGSGKSILLKAICGFIKPTSGSVYIDGVDIYKENKKNDLINMCFIDKSFLCIRLVTFN